MSDQSTGLPDGKDLTSEGVVRAWLLGYAWAQDTEAEKVAEVDCIMAQEGWRHLDVVVEHLMGQRSGENEVNEDVDSATGLALSTLYECHAPPHLPTCPYFKERP